MGIFGSPKTQPLPPPPPPAADPKVDDELAKQRRSLEKNRRGRSSLRIDADPGLNVSGSTGLRIQP